MVYQEGTISFKTHLQSAGGFLNPGHELKNQEPSVKVFSKQSSGAFSAVLVTNIKKGFSKNWISMLFEAPPRP